MTLPAPASVPVPDAGATDVPPPDVLAGAARRTHPATLILNLTSILPRMAQSIPALLGVGIGIGTEWLPLAAGIIVAVMLAGDALAWWRTTWAVGPEALTIASGILSRTTRVVPFDRIHDLSLERSLPARALGLAKVVIDTGAGQKQAGDAALNALPLAEAEALRDHVRAWRRSHGARPAMPGAGDPAHHDADHADADAPLFAMTMRRVLLAGLLTPSLAVIAVAFGLFQTAGDALRFDPFDPRFWRDVLADHPDWSAMVTDNPAATGIAGAVVVALLGLGTGIVRALVAHHGLTVTRTPTGLRRRAGLLTRTDQLIARARVEAAVFRQGVIARRLGMGTLVVQGLSQGTGGGGKAALAPLATLPEADRLLADVRLARPAIDDAADPVRREAGWTRPSALVIVDGLMGAALVATGVSAGIGIWAGPLFGAAAGIAVLLLGTLVAWGDWHVSGWRLVDGPRGAQWCVRSGVIGRTVTIAPVTAIQSVRIVRGVVGHALGLARLELGIPGGTDHAISGLRETDAHALRARLLVLSAAHDLATPDANGNPPA